MSTSTVAARQRTAMQAHNLDAFTFDLRRSVAAADPWVGSGWSTTAPMGVTTCGVGPVFAPPYAAPDAALRVRLVADGHPISDGARTGVEGHGLLNSAAIWRLGSIERRGTYHHYRAGLLTSFAVVSVLTPLHGVGGYALEISVRNRGDRVLDLAVEPSLAPGHPASLALGDWGWVQPSPGRDEATEHAPGRWSGNGVDVALDHGTLTARVEPDETAHFVLTVRCGVRLGPVQDPPALAAASRARTADRAHAALERIPQISTDIDGLAEYWTRSLASGLVCLWDNPAFVTSPFPATSGIDGGAVCAYAWDTGGYAPTLLTAMLGETAPRLLSAFTAADLAEHYAISPDGSGIGVPYAYTGWSLITFATAVAAQRPPTPELIRDLYALFTSLEATFDVRGELVDFGDQHSLLEMRGAGWEHVVASPNAERADALDQLAVLSQVTGAGLPAAAMRARAARIRQAVVAELWDSDAGWFRSVFPDGHTELTLSVQGFDAIRAGAETPAIAAAMLSRSRLDSFLGEYGVSAVADVDELHYERHDTDWSGAGSYTGESPQLALLLWERGLSEQAWDVLRRLFWMGRHLPYFPQDHYSDRPGTSPTGRRANIIAGLAGAEAILTGLVGLRPQPDGSLVFDPHPVEAGSVELTGLAWRGRTVDASVRPDRCVLRIDGLERYAGPPERRVVQSRQGGLVGPRNLPKE